MDRWRTPAPTPPERLTMAGVERANPDRAKTPCKVWASRLNAKWYRQLKELERGGAIQCRILLLLKHPRDCSYAWICPLTHFNVGLLVRCEVRFDVDTSTFTALLCRPLVHASSIDVFADNYTGSKDKPASLDLYLVSTSWDEQAGCTIPTSHEQLQAITWEPEGASGESGSAELETWLGEVLAHASDYGEDEADQSVWVSTEVDDAALASERAETGQVLEKN